MSMSSISRSTDLDPTSSMLLYINMVVVLLYIELFGYEECLLS